MIEYYLGEVPILANVETYRLEDAEVCEWVLERLDELVFKPVDGSGGKGIVIGPAASEAVLADLRAKVLADPRGWIAQEPVALSTAPTFVDGRMGARHLDLRPFAVNDGRDVWVVPGGLTRVALPARQPDRELQPGRRLEGHLGARGRRRTGREVVTPAAPHRAAAADARRRRRRLGPLPEQDSQQQQQQQQQ